VLGDTVVSSVVGACDGPATCGAAAGATGFLTSEGPAEADLVSCLVCLVRIGLLTVTIFAV